MEITTWETDFGKEHRLPLVTGKAPVTDKCYKWAKKGNGQMPVTDKTYS
jgi:hypothetical protein